MLGGFVRDVIARTTGDNFRLFGPDETASNRLDDVFEVTDRAWEAEIDPTDENLAPEGRVDRSPLRAPLPGLARGLPADRPPRALQLLRGVHPHRRLDVQPAREVAQGDAGIPWRRPVASLNYLLSSHVWRQDHNGFSHQDPGFIDHVVNKKAEIIRVYLPPDANTLLSVADHCLRSRNYVNVIVAGKQPALELPVDGRRDRPLHARSGHLGVGLERRRRHSRTSCSAAAATSPRSRRSLLRRYCASVFPS